jgi:hypothetical protein
MNKEMFERLTANIQKENRLESLPFCALKGDTIELISGHHRTRALREAGIMELHIIIDTTDLPRDAIKAKQLAHNSIQGEDDEQVLKQIYTQIESADYKLEAYMNEEFDINVEKVQIDDININTDYKTILVAFLDTQKALFEEVADEIISDYEGVYLAEKEVMEEFVNVLERTQKDYDIRSMGTVFTKMAEMVKEYLGEEVEEERIALKDLIGKAYVTNEFKELLDEAVIKSTNGKKITRTKRFDLIKELLINCLDD